jgi:hypothetical protein
MLVVLRLFASCSIPSQADFLALSGLPGLKLAAVLGQSAQAMSTFTNMYSAINGLLASSSPAAADVAASVAQAVYDRAKAVDATNASKV